MRTLSLSILLLVSFVASGQINTPPNIGFDKIKFSSSGNICYGYMDNGIEPLQNVISINALPEKSFAKELSELYSDYKKECWADSTENKTQLYTSCAHKECIEKTVSDYRKKLEENKPENSNNLGITVLNQGYLSSFYPSHKCTKKEYSHREPNFEGFMEYISKK